MKLRRIVLRSPTPPAGDRRNASTAYDAGVKGSSVTSLVLVPELRVVMVTSYPKGPKQAPVTGMVPMENIKIMIPESQSA